MSSHLAFLSASNPRNLDKSRHFTVHLLRPWRPGSARGKGGGPRRFTEVIPTPHAYSGQRPVKTKRASARSCASVVTRKRPSLNHALSAFVPLFGASCGSRPSLAQHFGKPQGIPDSGACLGVVEVGVDRASMDQGSRSCWPYSPAYLPVVPWNRK